MFAYKQTWVINRNSLEFLPKSFFLFLKEYIVVLSANMMDSNQLLYLILQQSIEEFEDTKGVIRIRISKNR
jgi:hypothetical protein